MIQLFTPHFSLRCLLMYRDQLKVKQYFYLNVISQRQATQITFSWSNSILMYSSQMAKPSLHPSHLTKSAHIYFPKSYLLPTGKKKKPCRKNFIRRKTFWNTQKNQLVFSLSCLLFESLSLGL